MRVGQAGFVCRSSKVMKDKFSACRDEVLRSYISSLAENEVTVIQSKYSFSCGARYGLMEDQIRVALVWAVMSSESSLGIERQVSRFVATR